MNDDIDIEEHNMKDEIDIEEQDMKDEIDIEEHDVLDNPRIRTIFSDLAQIKKEISGDYHDWSTHNVLKEHNYCKVTGTSPDSRIEYRPCYKSEDSRQYDQEDTSEYARFGNKISKPSSTLRISEEIQNGESVLVFGRKSVEIKQEAEEYGETTEEVHHPEDVHEEKYNSVSTVLTLGSTPSTSGVIEPLTNNDVSRGDNELAKSKTKFFDQKIDLNWEDNDIDHDIDTSDPKDPTAALILLENWGPRLENSSCYCKECLILFPSSNTLLAHNMTAHSFLVAVDKNKAVKSTAKPNVKKVSNDSGKFCMRCNVSDGLINYLYEKLTFAKNNAVFKPQPKKVVPNPSNKTVLPKQLEDDAELGSEMQVYDQEAVKFYQCQVCSIYLELYGFFVKHMINNHSETEFSEEKVPFKGTCLLCNTNVKDKQNYNKHIKLLHPEVYYYKGPITIPKGKVKKKQVGIKNNELAKSKTKFFGREIDFNCEDNDDYDIDTNDPKDSTAALVLLENWGPRLQNSSCYCKECLILFPTSNTLLAHNMTAHSFLLAVDNNKAVKSIAKPNVKKVSKATLHKCGSCGAHYIIASDLELHQAICQQDTNDTVVCEQCQLKFSKNCLETHVETHHKKLQLKIDDFQIIDYGDDDNIVKDVDIEELIINFSKDDDIKELTAKDIEENSNLSFTSARSTESEDSLVDKDDDTSESKNKTANKNVLYQCGKCKSCFNNIRNLKHHHQFCEIIQPNNKCYQCQLMFFSKQSLNAHISLHHRSDNFKFQVILVNYDEKSAISRVVKAGTSNKSLEITENVLNNYVLYQCGKCKSCFNDTKHLKQHYKKCKSIQSNEKCDQCLLKFLSIISLQNHINRHHTSDNFKFYVISVNYDEKSAISKVVHTVSSKNPLDKDDDMISEFKNKNKLSELSKLYQCDKCKSCFKCIKGTKQHYAECESIQPNNKCNKCQLMFLSKKSLNAHISVHHRSDNFKFHVILVNYDGKSVISPVVKTISSKKLLNKDDNTSKSKKRNANKNKLYQCGKCKGCFNSNSRTRQHYAECQSIQPNNKCDQCQLMFHSNTSLTVHINRHHRNDNFKFHVILVNYDEKSAISRVVKTVSSKRPLDKDDDTSESKNTNENRNKLYQCGKCKGCFNTKHRTRLHYAKCESIQPNTKCEQCQLIFVSNQSLNMHINRQHRSDNFKFHVILVNYDEKSAISRVGKTVSSKRPLDKGDDTSESKNTNANKNKLYQCGKCKGCFDTNHHTRQHYAECESIQPNNKCNQCQLMFLSSKSLNMHINRHHRNDNFKFHVILVNIDEKSAISRRILKTVSSKKPLDKDDDTSESKNKNAKKLSKLHQCGKCKTCFFTYRYIKRHYENCNSIQPNNKCEQCQLMFHSNRYLIMHINRHHRNIYFKFHVILVNYDEKKSALLQVVKTLSSKKPLEITENV